MWILILMCLIILAILFVLLRKKELIKISGGKPSIPNKEIYIVRHGQTDMNKEGKFYDNHIPEDDVDINETGVNQATQTGEYLTKYGPFDLIVASPRKRTMHTAELIAKQVGYKKPILTSELLFESTKGIFNGMTDKEYYDIWNNDKDVQKIENYTKSIKDPIEQNLYMYEFNKKLDAINAKKYKRSGYIKQMTEYEEFINWLEARKEQKILVVCHSGSEKGLTSVMLGVAPRDLPKPSIVDEFSNCTITYLRKGESPTTHYQRDKWYLISKTNNLHLKPNTDGGNDYKFVPVTRSNVKELKKLEVAEHQQHWVSNIIDALAQASFTKNWNGRVLYYGDKIVGFASYGESYPDSDTPNHTIKILKVMIDKSYQGKGHGKMLMKFLLDDIKLFLAHSDYPKCAYLGVNLDNTPAITLYKKLGFETINESKEHNGMLLKYTFE